MSYEQGWTNSVMVHEERNKIDLFVPCYLRTKLKNIVSLDSSTGIGLINVVIILSVYYDRIESMFPGIMESLSNNIVLRFKVDPPIKLQAGFLVYKNKDGE